jgi:hypothetical protein
MFNPNCSVGGDECSKPGGAILKGMCTKHYRRWQAADPSRPSCTMPGCPKPLRTAGLCSTHYGKKVQSNPSKPRCAIDGCVDPAILKGMCRIHYDAERRRGSALAPAKKRGNGTVVPFIRATVEADPDACVFLGSRCSVRFQGKDRSYTHVVMILAGKGEAPPGLEACHSCGNGHLGCITPRHLRWDTHQANYADAVGHGTATRPPVRVGSANRSSRVTEDQVLEIIDLIGRGGSTDAEIGNKFGASADIVRRIRLGRTWKTLPRPWGRPPPGWAETRRPSGDPADDDVAA